MTEIVHRLATRAEVDLAVEWAAPARLRGAGHHDPGIHLTSTPP